MFISFVLIQKKRTKEKIKTPTGYTVFVDQLSMAFVDRFHFIIPLYVHFFCLDTEETNQRKNQG